MKRFVVFIFVLCFIVSSMIVSSNAANISDIIGSGASEIHPLKDPSASSPRGAFDAVNVSFDDSASDGIHVKWSAVVLSGLPSGVSESSVLSNLRYALFVQKDDEWSRVAFTDGLSYVYKPKYPGKYTFAVQVTDKAYENAATKLSHGASMVYQDAPSFTTSIVTDGVKFSWKALSDVPKYRIYYKDDNGVWQKLGVTSSTSFVTSEIPYGTHDVTVRGMNSDGTLFYTDFIRGCQLTYLENPVFDSVTVTPDDNDIHLSWKSVEGSPKYAVYVKTEDGWKRIGCTSDTHFDYHPETVGSYVFTLRCIDNSESVFLSSYSTEGYEVVMPRYIIIGDADGDGCVTAIDATFLQRYIAGLRTPPLDTLAADVDRDGSITAIDVTLIQRHLAGMATPVDFGVIVL